MKKMTICNSNQVEVESALVLYSGIFFLRGAGAASLGALR